MGSVQMRVVAVTDVGFELEDGRFYSYAVPLDTVPTLSEFQEIYDIWSERLRSDAQSISDAAKSR